MRWHYSASDDHVCCGAVVTDTTDVLCSGDNAGLPDLESAGRHNPVQLSTRLAWLPQWSGEYA